MQRRLIRGLKSNGALQKEYDQLFCARVDFFNCEAGDHALLDELFDFIAREHSDYDRTFRRLSHGEQREAATPLRDEFIDFGSGYRRHRLRLHKEGIDDKTRQTAMKAVNPVVVLRNWLAQRAIEGVGQGDVSELSRLRRALETPFTDQDDDLTRRPPEWSKHLEVSYSS